jgi:DNA-binding response OmpR family regulator
MAQGPSGAGRADPSVHVLLVDDDDDLRQTLRGGLQAMGFTITAASTAAEALAALADARIRIDVIVMDLMLPDSWGPQVAMERTLYRPDTPVLYISGYSAGDAVLRASVAADDVPFLQKPFSVSELARSILAVARGGNPADG